MQPKYRRDSIDSKIPQANLEKTSDDVAQTNSRNSPQQFFGSDNFQPEVRTATRQSFWLKWSLAYTFGSGLGWPLSFWIPGNVFIDGAVVGFALGGSQWLLLRHISNRMKFWILLTTAGYATGYGIGVTFVDKIFSAESLDTSPYILFSAGYGITAGVMLGLAQWSILRLLFRESKIWILFVLMAETLGSAIGWGTLAEMTGYQPLICGGVSGAISGLITGKVMLRLLRLNKSQSLIV